MLELLELEPGLERRLVHVAVVSTVGLRARAIALDRGSMFLSCVNFKN